MEKYDRSAITSGIILRFIACGGVAIIIALTAIFSPAPARSFVPCFALLAWACVANAASWYFARLRGFPVTDFYYHWAGDLIHITVLVHFLGGADLPYGPFIYCLTVVASATFASRRGACVVAAAAAVCVAALVGAEGVGILEHKEAIWSHHYSVGAQTAMVFGCAVFFYLMADLAGTLSDQIKGAQERLAEQNVELERRVAERTQEIEQKRGELEELVHIVTHDLKNIAVATAETARKLVEQEGAELSIKGQRYTERIARDARAMMTLLKGMLDLVRQTAREGERRWVDVREVVVEAVARARHLIERKRINVRIGEVPPLYADPNSVQHVFENLVGNACRYVGDKPSPVVEVGGEERNGVVEYYIRDNGVGIAPDQLERIFKLYHRIPQPLAGNGDDHGYGIGLAVVRRLVLRHGGRIWVESVKGRGSTFYLSFPRAAVEEV